MEVNWSEGTVSGEIQVVTAVSGESTRGASNRRNETMSLHEEKLEQTKHGVQFTAMV